MTAYTYRRARALMASLMVAVIIAMPLSALAQATRISLHSNKYSEAQDVQLGRQAAAEAERQLPILRDAEVTDYVASVGQRLAASIPQEFQHSQFQYTFKVVDASDINAFALPGGPMYVNRGMIQAARNEGEMAGVMAHEMSHVALRHGTAQATKAQKYSVLAGIAGIAGTILGGQGAGQIGQAAVGAYFLKYSREYEKEADILGAHIMANAGYDPRDLANVFQTIERQGSGGGPEWLSDHPNPGNRYNYINQEARSLRINGNPIKNTAEFTRVQSLLRGLPRARSSAEIAQSGQSGQRYPSGDSNASINSRVSPPSSRYRTYTEGNLVRLSVPDNWRELSSGESVTFAPDGAYDNQGQFTHGVLLGLSASQSGDLRSATDEYIRALAQSNPQMRQQSNYQRGSVSGREALATTFSNVNSVTRRSEIITIYTVMMRNGNLFYVVAVAPQNEYRNYQNVFNNILSSVQLND